MDYRWRSSQEAKCSQWEITAERSTRLPRRLKDLEASGGSTSEWRVEPAETLQTEDMLYI